MSAFTPYKRVRGTAKDGTGPDGAIVEAEYAARELLRFPYNLTTILLSLPRYRTVHTERNLGPSDPPKEAGDGKKVNEGFLMKNILRRDDRKPVEEVRTGGDGGKFDDHASRVETLVSNLGKSDSGHRCIYCGKIYSRKYGLKIHVRTHTGYKPLKCKYCERPFGDPSNLNKHVRLHAQGSTPYKCQFCEKLLVRRRDLERHVKARHTNHSSIMDRVKLHRN